MCHHFSKYPEHVTHQDEVKEFQKGSASLPLTNEVRRIEHDAHLRAGIIVLPVPSYSFLSPLTSCFFLKRERESKRASGIIYESYAKKKPDHRVGGGLRNRRNIKKSDC